MIKISKGLRELFLFCVVGVINTLLDFIVLNGLLLATGNKSPAVFALIKSISFTIAAVNSYFLNKHFTFSYKENSIGTFSKFLSISIISFFINVGIASLIYALLIQIYPLHYILLGNVSAVIGTLVSLGVNFLGYKFIVFKKENDARY